ncbi:MAG: EAL domain-containing protein [Burkholderiaceae bacterium]
MTSPVPPPRDGARRQRLLTGAGVLALAGRGLALMLGLTRLPGTGARPGLAVPAVLAALAMAGVLGWVIHRHRRQDAELLRLRAREAHHENAERLAGLGLWTLEPGTRRLRLSRGGWRILGHPASLAALTIEAFVARLHPDDRDRWLQLHTPSADMPDDIRCEYRLLLPDGREHWVRSVARPVRLRDGRLGHLRGIIQDITGMRAMQRELAISEAKFRDLTLLSSDWVWETDAEHRLAYLSDSVDAVLGPWVRDLIGQTHWDASRPDPLPTDWQAMRGPMEAHEPFEQFEYSRLDDQRRVVHIALNGRPISDEHGRFAGYRGTGHDITREKQQRILLEMDGDIAAIMREQTDPERVISAVIITVCGKLAWLGGLHLVARDGRCVARERWGYPGFARMVADLPPSMATDDVTVEARAFRDGKAIWLNQAELEVEFARRYKIREVGAQAAFIAPISDENGQVMSALLFLAPVGYQGDEFLGQVAAMLSRALSLYLQRTQAERRLRRASEHDALTGLPNRAFVSEQLDRLLAARRPIALLYLDLDRYKIINDTLGHSAGDKALVEVARRLAQSLPEGDIAGRMGGDEFVVLLHEPGGREAVERIARDILRAIEQPLVLSDRAWFLSASIGVAMAPDDGSDASLLVQAADAAMYQVKSEGRNDVRFFSGDLQASERAEQLQLVSELPFALKRGEVDLYYQPVLDIGQRKVLSVEGLLRWRHPTRGLLLPDRFLPMAEQSNLIREIGFWAVRRAIDDRIELGLTEYDDMAVSVNISVRQLAEEGFLENLLGLIQERNFPPHLLSLELTESSFIENPQRAVARISDLRRAGVRCIIDNFGTGYASLSYIKNLPVDGLKIDRAFVRDLPADRGNAAIVQAVTTLGQAGHAGNGEGVETAPAAPARAAMRRRGRPDLERFRSANWSLPDTPRPAPDARRPRNGTRSLRSLPPRG